MSSHSDNDHLKYGYDGLVQFESSCERHDLVYSLCAAQNKGDSLQRGGHQYGAHFLKVPVDQRRANEEAYNPLLFSFGPYHAHAQFPAELTDGDALKMKVAETVLSNTDGLRQISDQIEEWCNSTRNLYVQLSSPDQLMAGNNKYLAEILAVDGTTLVEAAREAKKTDALLAYSIVRLVRLDGIILENQVPIFVLDCALNKLKQTSSSTDDQPTSIHQVLYWYCKCVNPFPDFLECHMPPSLSSNMEEPLLSYIYDFLTEGAGTGENISVAVDEQKSTHDQDESSDFNRPSLPTASHLLRCGVRFKPNEKMGFKGIRFDERSMELRLPRIMVGDTTVRFLHNLIAYEATARYPRQFSVISYVYFMDRLIDTREDVQVLVSKGVLGNTLGSDEELASCWNKLCVSVSCRATKNDQQIMERMDALAKQQYWRKWMATFKETYWEKQPWLLFSIVAAVVLLVLSFLQTIYTMKG